MMKKLICLLAALFLFSCAQAVRAPVKMEPNAFMRNYDTMFSAAMNKGTELFYTIEEQNRQTGLIKMTRKVKYSTYMITVKFDEDSFTVKTNVDTDIINLFIDNDAQMIEAAVIKAAKQ